jgi:hypothetical protein
MRRRSNHFAPEEVGTLTDASAGIHVCALQKWKERTKRDYGCQLGVCGEPLKSGSVTAGY